MGTVLIADPDGHALTTAAAPHVDPELIRQLSVVPIGPEVGTCGRAAYLGETTISTDLAADPRWGGYAELAAAAGLRACWSVPFRSPEGRVLGTMAAYASEPRGPSPEELRRLEWAAEMAGLLVQTAGTGEDTRSGAAGLRGILEAADELIRIDGLDPLCRRAVELAREELGLERCGLVLLDSETGTLVGTYGTGIDGATTDERSLRLSAAGLAILDTTAGPLPRWRLDTPARREVRNGESRLVGQGWVVATPLVSSRGPIGIFYNDAALTNAPLDPQRQDTLVLYCSLLANILERRRAEEALGASESRYRRMFEENRAVQLLVDPEDGAIVDANPAALLFYGASREELCGRTLAELTTQPPAQVRQTLLDASRQRLGWFRLRSRLADGSERTVEVHASPLDLGGRNVLYCILHDVTEGLEAEAALRRTESRLALVLENLPGVVFYETGGGKEFVTESAGDLFGYRPGELAADRTLFPSLIHPDDFQEVDRRIRAWHQEGEPGILVNTFRVRHRDGRELWVEDHMVEVQDADGGKHMAGVMIDVTERMLAEQSLRASEERFRRIFDEVPLGMAVVGPDGALRQVNRRLCDLLGLRARQLLQRRLEQFLPDDLDAAERERIESAVNGRRPFQRLQVPLRSQDGSCLWVEITAAPFRDTAAGDDCALVMLENITERRRAEEALRASEEHFRTVIENTGDLIVLYDTEGTICYVSPSVTRVLGYEPDELLGRKAILFAHPDDQAAVADALEALLQREGKGQPLETRFRHRDGSWRALESLGKRLDAPLAVGGRQAVAVVNSRDVTERRRALEELRWVTGSARCILWSAEVRRTEDGLEWETVLTSEEAARELLPLEPAPGESYTAAFARLRTSAEPSVDVYFIPDPEAGVRHYSRFFSWRPPQGPARWFQEDAQIQQTSESTWRVVGVCVDISDRRRAEERDAAFLSLGQRLNQATAPEEAARTILAVADELIGWDACWLEIGDPSGSIGVTQVLMDEFEGGRQEVEAPMPSLLSGPLGRAAIEIGPQLWNRGGEVPYPGPRFGNPDRMARSVLCVPIRSGDACLGALSIQSYLPGAYDESDLETLQALADYCVGALERTRAERSRRALEEQLRHSQKMEAVGRLAGGVAHDFNNMLGVISGYSDLLLERPVSEEALRTCLGEIKSACDRAASLTRQLLAFSRKQVVAVRPVDLNALVQEMEGMLRRLIRADIELVTDLDPALGLVRADAGQLEQVILNLVVNARDAMPEGGRILLETRAGDRVPAARLAGREGPTAVLRVTDNGLGMDPETTARIFEPFFTTKERGKGTGLGLSTVYGIVEGCGGDIQVESELGKGTTFQVILPAEAAAEGQDQGVAAPRAGGSATGTETILLVEDEPMLLRLLEETLRQKGYTVLAASRGEDALRLCGGHAGPIHLLLTDVMMPGLNGRELAERLCPEREEMRVLFMSGYTDDAALRSGVLDERMPFIQKPFLPEALARKVREVLDSP